MFGLRIDANLIDPIPIDWDCSILEFSAALSLGWEERRTMKASNFSESQTAFILMQGADGVPVAEISQKAGISQATQWPPTLVEAFFQNFKV
jgi:hypothetical protein